MIRFLDLNSQYIKIKSEIDEAIESTIADSAFIGGTAVKAFEAEFAEFQHAKHCIGVGNGTDALEIAIEALDLPKGSEIIVPANSFIATAEAVTRSGCRVVFCDSDKDNYTISLSSLREKITERTSAVIAVHLYGHPCNIDDLMAIAKTHNLKVVEDCAQAHGAEINGVRVGAIGDVGTFSFYPGKNLGAYGDGGAIVTNDESLAVRCRMIANHGRVKKYDHEFEGRNSRLDGLQAAILSVKLRHLEAWTKQRIKIADAYLKGLKDVDGLVLPKREAGVRQVYHLFVIRTERRDELQKYLKHADIQCGIHYPIALPKLQAYEYLGQRVEDFVAHKQDSQLLSLPIGEHLTGEDAAQIMQVIGRFFD